MPVATRLLIGNDFSQDLRSDRGWAGWWVQRLLWFAESGDVVLLPSHPDPAFARYVTGLTEVDMDSLQVVVPEGFEEGSLLDAQSLAEPALHNQVRAAIGDREVREVVPLWPDASVAQLCTALGLREVLAGYGFVAQGGGRLVNSKSVFRPLAGGVGAPIPKGGVCASPEQAEHVVVDLLRRGPAIVKQDYLSGGHGNEILSPDEEFRPIGARRVVVVPSRAAVRAYFRGRWDALTSGGRDLIVIEQYFRDSRAYFMEFDVRDDVVELSGTGEMLSAPFAIGQIMPAPDLGAREFDALIESGWRLGNAVQAMGYRGKLSADAIVTPERGLYFTEYNGRVTGSTHIYERIGRRVVGDGYGGDRLILERVWPPGWRVASFEDALDRLVAAGAAYAPDERRGVVLSNAFDQQYFGVMYCIVSDDLDSAWRRDRELRPLFSR